ncbi:MAG: hypothetical protein ACRDGQ_14415 [Candidatus Limnocylindrales bacterium]
MELISSDSRHRPTDRALAIARVIGALYLATGLGVAWLTLTTPFVDVLAAHGQTFAGQATVHAIALLVALVLPGLCLVVGAHRVLDFVEIPAPWAAAGDPLAGLASRLDGDHAAVRYLVLPGGRQIGRMIVGPQGVVVVGRLPSASQARQVDGRWEGRVHGGEWVAIEDPLERTARDAEAVRRWLVAGEPGFVIKVYAAVIADTAPLSRTSATAIVRRGQLPAFLASLPPHRTFTASRRKQVLDRIRGSLAGSAA